MIYDARNNQKKIEFPEITEVSNYSCEETELSVTWKDGHNSKYNLLDLEHNFFHRDNRGISLSRFYMCRL